MQSPENLNIVKYLLSHKICKPMLLSLGKDSPQQPQPVLPLDLARKQLVSVSIPVDDGDTITYFGCEVCCFSLSFCKFLACMDAYLVHMANDFYGSSAYIMEVGTWALSWEQVLALDVACLQSSQSFIICKKGGHVLHVWALCTCY